MMLLAFVLAAAATYDTATVRLTVQPQPVLVEEGETGRALNFDLILDNPTEAPIDIDEVQVSVYDRAGQLLLRKFVDGSGTRPSVRTLDVAEVPAKGRALVFNPFHRFERDLDLARLVYDVKLSGKQGSPLYAAQVTVEPKPYATKTALVLPVKGRLIVWDGHDFYAHHRRWDTTIPMLQQLGFRTNAMRYSYDFVPVDDKGGMSAGDEGKNESWLGFGKELRAAGDGVVASVEDGRADDRTFDPRTMNGDLMQVLGNYVVIDHGNGEFSVYGHIKQGSAKVKKGQRVKQGDPVAAIGASGSSRFPHLHYELQTGPDLGAEGLPSTFQGFDRVRGAVRVPVKAGLVDSGEIVESR